MSAWHFAGAVVGGVVTVDRVLGRGLGWCRFPGLLLCRCCLLVESGCGAGGRLGGGGPRFVRAVLCARGAWGWCARSLVPAAAYIWFASIFWPRRVWPPPSAYGSRWCARRRRCGPHLDVFVVSSLLLHRTLCLCCVCVCPCVSRLFVAGYSVCCWLRTRPLPCGPLCVGAVHAGGTYLLFLSLLCLCGVPF